MSIRSHFGRRSSRLSALIDAAVGRYGRLEGTKEIWNQFNISSVAPTKGTST